MSSTDDPIRSPQHRALMQQAERAALALSGRCTDLDSLCSKAVSAAGESAQAQSPNSG